MAGHRRVDVAIVVVTYNSAPWIEQCLTALPAAVGDRSAEIVVVDNASSDGSAELASSLASSLAQERSDLAVVQTGANLGFAGGVNAGVRATTAPWVLLVNPDTEARPGSVAALLDFAEAHPEFGVYGGRTLTADGHTQRGSCWGLPTVWSTACFALGLSTLLRHSRLFDPESLGRWDRDSVREVGMVTGCLLLVSRADWERLDGMDERYFVYGEDADFNARARALGLRPVITPDAVVMHVGGSSSTGPGGSMPLILAGRVTYAHTHFGPLRARLVVALLRTGVAVRAAGSLITGRGRKWAVCWRQRRSWQSGFAPR